MMQNMMGSMDPQDMQKMMPKCMDMMFSRIEPEKRSAFAAQMLNRMHDQLKKYADGEPEKDTSGTATTAGDKKDG